MSRPAFNNVTVTTIPTLNKATAGSNVVHPSGHTLTLYADGAIWDETSNKALLPQDLTRL